MKFGVIVDGQAFTESEDQARAEQLFDEIVNKDEFEKSVELVRVVRSAHRGVVRTNHVRQSPVKKKARRTAAAGKAADKDGGA